MRKLLGLCLALQIGLLVVGCYTPKEEPTPPEEPPSAALASIAMANIESRSGSYLSGGATFTGQDGSVTLALTVTGTPPGMHAVHIHEIGDCSAEDGTSAGGHWNPTGADHGRWGEEPYHRGDIGNMVVGEDGTGELTLTSLEWSIGGAPETDILAKSIIVHADADDFTSQPTGAAGGRIGCGVIEVQGQAADAASE